MAPTRYWSEMSWTDFQSPDMHNVIAVLPIAAVEQHGPHLPVGLDSFIMEGYLRRVVDRMPEWLAAIFLPIQRLGASLAHTDFPGTLSLSPSTAALAWTEIGESVYRAGCRKLVIVNAHGGNSPVIDLVARSARATRDVLRRRFLAPIRLS